VTPAAKSVGDSRKDGSPELRNPEVVSRAGPCKLVKRTTMVNKEQAMTSTYAGLTTEEILARLEVEELAAEEGQTFKGHKVATFARSSRRSRTQDNWKAPWAAVVPHQAVGMVMAATEFFHADRATVVGIEQLTGRVLLRGNGYQC
jgi:hypothetical protein